MAQYTTRQYLAIEAFESFFSFLHDDADYITMEAISKTDRSKLKDSDFGLPEKRKYPIINEDTVKNSIKYFRFCPAEDQPELAKNLLKAIEKFKIEVRITKDNPFLKYYPDATIIPRTRNPKKEVKIKAIPMKV